MTRTTLESVSQEIKDIKELMQTEFGHGKNAFKRIDDHLTELNGKVADHEVFKSRAIGALAILVFITGLFTIGQLFALFKNLLN
ncbi:hypothetical protein HYU06_01490 [Candidatus Woesearchaeota archaeon]|nr:hypothetical protein [Candidatus Woesearchaeota archaeon]